MACTSHRALVRRIRARYGLRAGGAATIYVLHFTQPVGHARHYLGFTGYPVEVRIATHRAGRGARLIKRLMADGGDVELVLAFKVSLDVARTVERRLKTNYSGIRLCPRCLQASLDRRNVAAKARYAQNRKPAA